MALSAECWNGIISCWPQLAPEKPRPVLRILGVRRHYKTCIVYLMARDADGTAAYVAKVSAHEHYDDWDPHHEYAALLRLGALAKRSQSWSVPVPVGCTLTPRILVTHFVPGVSMRYVAQAGMRAWATARQLAQSTALCRRAGECLGEMRRATARVRLDEGRTAMPFLAFCQERLDEIGRFSPMRRPRLALERISAALTLLVRDAWHVVDPCLTEEYGSHGDFSLQNLLLESETSICMLDLEGFRFSSFNDDYATFRFRLEHMQLKPWYRRRALVNCWNAFHVAATESDDGDAYALSSYLRKMLAHVAWIYNPQRKQTDSARIRYRNALWVRERLAWLRRLSRAKTVQEMCGQLRWDL